MEGDPAAGDLCPEQKATGRVMFCLELGLRRQGLRGGGEEKVGREAYGRSPPPRPRQSF